MARILLLTPVVDRGYTPNEELSQLLSIICPALAFLPHAVEIFPSDPSLLINIPNCDLVAIDSRKDLGAAKTITKLIAATSNRTPIILITSESSLPALSASWGFSDLILDSTSVGELDSRIRIAIEGKEIENSQYGSEIRSGEIVIDEKTFTAKIRGQALDLTYKEFELLKFMAQHPGRVFTRSQLLQEIWGYDYYGGTRTVDVHIRRLRAKLGPESEAFIGTVRNVGYRFNDDSNKNNLSIVD
jgi:DNA-binding response OmpR family regulator